MNKRFFLIPIIILGLLSCKEEKVDVVALDQLIEDVEYFEGKRIETEGLAVHFCGAEEKKLKLKSANGSIVKVVPDNILVQFNAKLKHKKLKLTGRVECEKIERAFVDEIAREKTLLCHIDHTPCLDKDWVKRKQETGVADSLSAAEVKSLRDKMQKSGKDYVRVVSILAEKIEIIEE
ncbi:hypothetical protein [Marinifilum caeruleilacunae]|uniref:Lipoprotein n=1 Tax=Marinifilum caeruleilacunae TaxID=2499076 RepID=A0ABX1WVL9_9BACT|nr:hypothetical protein [Marinifilum caeruleilacunae]NOU60160.1 hypothetical protein [Marinifilum caeruleilacunae]